MINKLPIIGISRLRIDIDGPGVTTLVGSYGCPLSCNYCLNPESWQEKIKVKNYSCEELYDAVKIDDLYFQATNGGITFGGGESLLHANFIKEFSKLCKDKWNINAETSLNIQEELLRIAINSIDYFIVDIKDMNNKIYEKYTGTNNNLVISNLKILLSEVGNDRIRIKIPSIKDFNNSSDIENTINKLNKMGFINLETFTYITDIKTLK